MVRIPTVLITGLVILAAAGAGQSEAAPASSEAAPPDHIDATVGGHGLLAAFDKLGRGVSNALFGWLEIPATMSQHYDERNTGGSLVAGAVYGTVRGLVRTGVGIFETVTFLLPIPEDYAPILPTLPYFDKQSPRRPLPLE